MKKNIVFSGIQPSGIITLGNYLGALRQFVAMQNEHDCYYCIVDLHAITVRQDPKILQENIKKLAAFYLACGLNPEKSTIFIQSHVAAHSELAWVLNCYAQIGELSRMTQFKEKSKKHKDNINVGLYTYPVLQAADILLYNTNIVPIGEDQKQHVELCRDIAIRFNHLYGNIFTIPQHQIQKQGARIMGLDDPTQKMSKSAKSEYNYISLLDPPETVRKKIMKATADSGREVKYDTINKPGISNLITIYLELSGKKISDLNKYNGYGDFKKDVAEAICEFVLPIQEKYYSLLKNQKQLDKILNAGAKKANQAAELTINKVYQAIGIR